MQSSRSLPLPSAPVNLHLSHTPLDPPGARPPAHPETPKAIRACPSTDAPPHNGRVSNLACVAVCRHGAARRWAALQCVDMLQGAGPRTIAFQLTRGWGLQPCIRLAAAQPLRSAHARLTGNGDACAGHALRRDAARVAPRGLCASARLLAPCIRVSAAPCIRVSAARRLAPWLINLW